MKKLLLFMILSSFAYNALADDKADESIGQKLTELGDIVFYPVKVVNYLGRDHEYSDGETAIAAIKFGAGFTFPVVWANFVYGDQTFHRQMLNSKAILDEISPKLITNTQIDAVLASIEAGGITGNQRVVLVLHDPSAKKVAFRNLTKAELERSLQKMANHNTTAFSIKVGNTNLKYGRVFGSTLAVYLSLDFIHTLASGDI